MTRRNLEILDDDQWDQKMFFCEEEKAHQDLAWLVNHNGKMREYMLVADVTPRKKQIITLNKSNIDLLDDELPSWF